MVAWSRPQQQYIPRVACVRHLYNWTMVQKNSCVCLGSVQVAPTNKVCSFDPSLRSGGYANRVPLYNTHMPCRHWSICITTFNICILVGPMMQHQLLQKRSHDEMMYGTILEYLVRSNLDNVRNPRLEARIGYAFSSQYYK
jgi:hypothetical protein